MCPILAPFGNGTGSVLSPFVSSLSSESMSSGPFIDANLW